MSIQRSFLFSLALVAGVAACHHNNGGTTTGNGTSSGASAPTGEASASPGTAGPMQANDPSMQNPNSSLGPHTPTPPPSSTNSTNSTTTSGQSSNPVAPTQQQTPSGH